MPAFYVGFLLFQPIKRTILKGVHLFFYGCFDHIFIH